MEWIPKTYMRDSQGSWQKHWTELKWTKTEQNEEKLLNKAVRLPKFSRQEQADKTIPLQIPATFHDKGRMTPGMEPGTQGAELQVQRTNLGIQKVNQWAQIIIPWCWNLIEFVLPSWISKLLMINKSFLHSTSPILNGNVSKWCAIPVPPLYFGSR